MLNLLIFTWPLLGCCKEIVSLREPRGYHTVLIPLVGAELLCSLAGFGPGHFTMATFHHHVSFDPALLLYISVLMEPDWCCTWSTSPRI